jgi:GT2 family glycosyltransferase
MFSSVVICTYNRSHLLRRVLHSLAEQTLSRDKFEIIVVNDGSDDDTAGVCETMQAKMANMRYISAEKNIGLSNAANLGILSSRGDYILFIDDDCIAYKDWVERLISALDRESVVAGSIASPLENYIKLCHNISQFHPFMPGRKAGKVEFIAGANMGFRRSVLEELNGFQQGLRIPTDTELILRARMKGYQIYFAPDAVVTHDPERTTLASVFRYSSEHASATILLRNEYRSLLRTPFVLCSPILILFTSPFIALKVTFDIYRRNFNLAKLFWTAPLVYGLKLAWCWGAARGLKMNKTASTRAMSTEDATTPLAKRSSKD